MPPDDAVRIRHMIEAMDAAARFIIGRTRSDLDKDLMLLFALVRAVEIVGEAATKVSVETRTRWPALPWSEAAAMRNRLVHAYFDINKDILWNTVTDSFPGLRMKLQAIQSEDQS